jgi:hypothetical protein
VEIDDPDGSSLTRVEIRLTNPVDEDDFGSSLESLVVKDLAQLPDSIVVGAYDPNTGKLVLSAAPDGSAVPTAPHGDFETALEQIGYLNSSDDPTGDDTGTLDRIIEVVAFDEDSDAEPSPTDSPTAVSRIRVVPDNDAPTLDLDADDETTLEGETGFEGVFIEGEGPADGEPAMISARVEIDDCPGGDRRPGRQFAHPRRDPAHQPRGRGRFRQLPRVPGGQGLGRDPLQHQRRDL